jgi:DNA-binding response OmpR family regulator
MRVLLIESEPVLAGAARMVLERRGQVVHAGSTDDALVAVQEDYFDAVVLNPDVRGRSAVELLDLIEQLDPDLMGHIVLLCRTPGSPLVRLLVERWNTPVVPRVLLGSQLERLVRASARRRSGKLSLDRARLA